MQTARNSRPAHPENCHEVTLLLEPTRHLSADGTRDILVGDVCSLIHALMISRSPTPVNRYPHFMDDLDAGTQPRRLVWSEVRDLLDMTGCVDVAQLIGALEQYRADPPLPGEAVPL